MARNDETESSEVAATSDATPITFPANPLEKRHTRQPENRRSEACRLTLNGRFGSTKGSLTTFPLSARPFRTSGVQQEL